MFWQTWSETQWNGGASAETALRQARADRFLTTEALPLLAWDATVQLEQCGASALTVRAQQACADEFTRQVEERTGVPQLRP